MNPGDEELVEFLRNALRPQRPDSITPPPGAVAQLRDSVSARFAHPRAGRRRGARLAVAFSLFLGMSGSAAGAFASGAILPTPLRVVARDIGLPVDSVDLAQAKTDADRLRGALDRGETGQISRDAAALQSTFAELSGNDRRRIEPEVDGLLDRAVPYDGHSDDGPGPNGTAPAGGSAPGSGTSTSGGDGDDGGNTPTAPTSVPQGQVVAPSTNDGGGGDGGGADGSSTTSTTAPQSGSGDGAPPTTIGGTDGGGGGTSDGGSVVQTDGGGH